jgi:hypothetical protein
MDAMQRTLHTQHRSKLQALIFVSGYPTIQHFCRATKIDEATAILILKGQLIPSKNFIKKTAIACRTARKNVVKALY